VTAKRLDPNGTICDRDPRAAIHLHDAANLSSHSEGSRSHLLSAENEIAIDSPVSVVAQLITALAGLATRSLLGALIVYAGKLAEHGL
jgi:hypothetical protein